MKGTPVIFEYFRCCILIVLFKDVQFVFVPS
jgi:hypothetical protein